MRQRAAAKSVCDLQVTKKGFEQMLLNLSHLLNAPQRFSPHVPVRLVKSAPARLRRPLQRALTSTPGLMRARLQGLLQTRSQGLTQTSLQGPVPDPQCTLTHPPGQPTRGRETVKLKMPGKHQQGPARLVLMSRSPKGARYKVWMVTTTLFHCHCTSCNWTR